MAFSDAAGKRHKSAGSEDSPTLERRGRISFRSRLAQEGPASSVGRDLKLKFETAPHPKCEGIEKKIMQGSPDPAQVPRSFGERHTPTMRMGMQRFTRLTNGFSKKVENHACQVALHFMHYNSARIHKTLRVTPAQEAGISQHVWTLEEIADLVGRRFATWQNLSTD